MTIFFTGLFLLYTFIVAAARQSTRTSEARSQEGGEDVLQLLSERAISRRVPQVRSEEDLGVAGVCARAAESGCWAHGIRQMQIASQNGALLNSTR